MKHRIISSALFAAVLLPLLPACTHKEIVEPSSRECIVNISFEWDYAGKAAADGMSVWFYSEDGDEPAWRFDIPGNEGGSVRIPAGNYRIVFFNNDTYGIKFISDSTPGPYASLLDGETLSQPDMLFSGSVERLRVTPCGVSYLTLDGETVKDCPKSLVRAYPFRRTRHYTVIVTDVKNLDNLASASASLGGMASSINLADGKPRGAEGSIPFAMTADRSDLTLSGSLDNFGPADGSENRLVIRMKLRDGRVFDAKYDVTSQTVNSETPFDVIIILKNLEIPAADSDTPIGDGGIEAGVSGWTIVETDIIV